MTTKKAVLIMLIVAVVVVIAWKLPQRQVVAPTVETPSGTASSLVGAQLDTNGNFEYSKESEFVSIKAVYPSKTKLSDEADVRARTTMEAWIKTREAAFMSNTIEMIDAAEKVRLRESGRSYVMGIEYVTYSFDEGQSFVFQIYEDTGGAHPNSYYRTFVFDTSGTELTLGDLFKSDARYLEKLSELSYADILRQAPSRFGAALDEDQKDWVRTGTAPSLETFQSYYLNGDSMVLIFPPYQVAAYAAGVFEVKIPLSKLAGILR